MYGRRGRGGWKGAREQGREKGEKGGEGRKERGRGGEGRGSDGGEGVGEGRRAKPVNSNFKTLYLGNG